MPMKDMKRVSDLQEKRINYKRIQKKLKLKNEQPSVIVRVEINRTKEEWDALVKKAHKNRWTDL